MEAAIKMKISVILPVYSEKETLVYIVNKLVELLKNKLQEIIIIFSPDSCGETFQIINKLCQAYSVVRAHVQVENPGLGRAIRQGISLSHGTHILIMDSDLEMDPEAVFLMIKKMEQTGSDMVVGSRWMKEGRAVGYGIIKYFFNRSFQCIFRFAFWTSLHDLTLGFKLMKRELAVSLPWNSIFHEIAVETTLRPLKKGYHIEEIPIVWRRRVSGKTKNPFRRNFRYLLKAFEILIS